MQADAFYVHILILVQQNFFVIDLLVKNSKTGELLCDICE
jgi:hypothetical protein